MTLVGFKVAYHCLEVEYHANAEYENPLTNSEKIACVGQRLMYPIVKKNTLPCYFFVNAI